jgi:hypothetical protein
LIILIATSNRLGTCHTFLWLGLHDRKS